MVVTLGVGSLAIVSLVVVTVVCVLVTLLLTILTRSSRPRMEHCSHCHRPVFIKGAKVPPYYNCQLSPRAAGPVTWSQGEGGQISCLLEGQPSAHNSLVFKRSCSTRKKIRTHPTESEAGSFFRSVMSRISPSQRPDNNISVEFSRPGEQVRIREQSDTSHDYLHPLNDRDRFKRVMAQISQEGSPDPSLALERNRNSWGSTLPAQYRDN